MNYQNYYNAIFITLYFLANCEKVAYSQSLLDNGNFEKIYKIPTKNGQAYQFKGWNNYNLTTFPVTGFYNSKNGLMPKLRNKIIQESFSGNGFIGLGYNLTYPNKSQFIFSKLSEVLKKDTIYNIVLWVSLADNVRYGVDKLNCRFSNSDTEIYNLNTSANVVLREENGNFLLNKKSWLKLTGKYKAKGGELYFILGGVTGFKKKMTSFSFTLIYLLKKNYTYYFIDDISIHKEMNAINASTPNLDENISNAVDTEEKVDQPKIFSHLKIYFKRNDYQISDEYFSILDDFTSKTNENDSIVIYGYSDTLGTKVHNFELAKKRVNEIMTYIEKKKHINTKIEIIGEIHKDQHYQNNRYVEIILKNKHEALNIKE